MLHAPSTLRLLLKVDTVGCMDDESSPELSPDVPPTEQVKLKGDGTIDERTTPRERATYTKKAPEFWEMLASEFLEGGISMAVLAEKHGVSAPLLRYHLQRISADGTLERRKAFLEKAKAVGESMAVVEKEKAKVWTEEQVERCYVFREKIDEHLLAGEPTAKDVAYLSSAEERNDRVARRSMGIEDKVGISGSVDVHGIVGLAVRVFEQRVASGEAVEVDVDFELIASDNETNVPHSTPP